MIGKILGSMLFGLQVFAAQETFFQAVSKQEIIKHGKRAYENRCSGCHGLKGNGLGPAAPFLDPKPRDFTKGMYKFRSTPIGSLPTDKDLMRVLSNGVKGTSMPNFATLPEQTRFSIVQYIKTFFPGWKEKKKESEPIVTGAPFPVADFKSHAPFMARAKKGRELFGEACMVCHGATGLGNGSGAEDLEDDWGFPIKPANLTKRTIKRGKSVRDIYATLISGLEGTPMVSFKETYTDEQLWDISAYVLYLRGIGAGTYDKNNPPLPVLKEEEE